MSSSTPRDPQVWEKVWYQNVSLTLGFRPTLPPKLRAITLAPIVKSVQLGLASCMIGGNHLAIVHPKFFEASQHADMRDRVSRQRALCVSRQQQSTRDATINRK